MKVLIVSEESNAKQIISNALSHLSFDIQITSVVDDDSFEEHKPKVHDLIIVDDELFIHHTAFKSKFFDHLHENDLPFIVIMTQKNRAYAYENFNLIDYFTAPIDWHRVQLRIRLMQKSFSETSLLSHVPEKFFIKSKSEVRLLDYDQIMFFEKEGKKLHIHLMSEEIIICESFKDLIKRIPQHFVRVHNSYIVNTKFISKIVDVGNRSYQIAFTNYEKVAHMSRYRSEVLLDKFYRKTMGV